MWIEVTGASAINKGGQLMLRCLQHQMVAHVPGSRLCACIRHHLPAPLPYGLHAIVPKRRGKPNAVGRCRAALDHAISRLIPRGWAERRQMARLADVAGLFDISGAMFSDKFDVSGIRRFAAAAATVHDRSGFVALLPQMFGPFDSAPHADAMRMVMKHVNVAYARDRVSAAHMRKLGVDDRKIAQAPDLTIFLDAPPPSEPIADGPYACIIPNEQVTRRAESTWAREYPRRLARAAEHLRDAGMTVHLVLHANHDGDRQLARAVIAASHGAASAAIIERDDPVEIKSVIAGAQAVLSSRFHGLVAALSSGVPAMAIGWAHKYQTLLEDFATPDMWHGQDHDTDQLIALLDRACDATQRTQLVDHLKQSKAAMAVEHQRMWRYIAEHLAP
jgi:colanic acid/amylovoran biosynthesis protein